MQVALDGRRGDAAHRGDVRHAADVGRTNHEVQLTPTGIASAAAGASRGRNLLAAMFARNEIRVIGTNKSL